MSKMKVTLKENSKNDNKSNMKKGKRQLFKKTVCNAGKKIEGVNDEKDQMEDQSAPETNKKKSNIIADTVNLDNIVGPDLKILKTDSNDSKERKYNSSRESDTEETLETFVEEKHESKKNRNTSKQEKQVPIPADLSEIKRSIYPRTCPDCLSIYNTKCSFYKHKTLNTCKRKKKKLQDIVKKSPEKEVVVKSCCEKATDCDKDEIIRKLKKQIAHMKKQKCGNCKSSEVPIKMEFENDQPIFVKEVLDEQLSDQQEDTLEENIEDLSNELYSILCETCKGEYKNQASFKKHLAKCETKDKKTCSNCDRVLGDKAFYGHVKRCNRSKILSNLATLASIGEEFSEEEDDDNFAALFPSMSNTQLDTEFFQCHHCSTLYFSRYTFICHLKNNICGNVSKRISCLYKECDIKFTRYDHLLLHLPHYHNDASYVSKIKYFRTFASFEKWKEDKQNETFSYLIKCRGTKKYKGTEYMYYECQFNAVCDGKKGPKRKTERRKKAGVIPYMFCPARMSVLRDIATGNICVSYIAKHSHELSHEHVKYQRFPKSVINHILQELKKGATAREIKDFYQKDMANVDGFCLEETDLKQTHLITIPFITQLKCKLSKEGLLGSTKSCNVTDEEHYEVRFVDGSEEFKLVPIPNTSLSHEKSPEIETCSDPEIITVDTNIDDDGNIVQLVTLNNIDEIS